MWSVCGSMTDCRLSSFERTVGFRGVSLMTNMDGSKCSLTTPTSIGYPTVGAKFSVIFLSPFDVSTNRSENAAISLNDSFFVGISSSLFSSSVVCIENCSWNLPFG